MIPCPPGYYCPDGVDSPIACPKGTFNNYERSTDIQRCSPCPAGTACDVTGISDYKRKYCPPGYYCERGTFAPAACPPGTFRPNMGAADEGPASYSVTSAGGGAKSCFKCVGGYFCQTKATVVPELCPAGYYCPEGAIAPKKCEPGYYCDSGSASMTKCPQGFFCNGGSDKYFKCPFGTYCPEGSPTPTPCPDGYYGSGSSKNYDIESGCKTCGRGMYSENDPT